MAYGEQLKIKTKAIGAALELFIKRLQKTELKTTNLLDWTKEAKYVLGAPPFLSIRLSVDCCKCRPEKGSSLLFPLLPIVASPVTDTYRSKCEFSFGHSPSGEPCIGFLLGQFREGVTTVMEPSRCAHVHPTAKKIVACMQVRPTRL